MTQAQSTPTKLPVSLFRICLSLFFLLALFGCTVKWIADYDPEIDKSITEIMKKTETFFATLETQIGTPAADYSNHSNFYKDIRVDLRVLKFRAESIGQNKLTVDQIKIVLDMLNKIEQIHQKGFKAVGEIALERNALARALQAILKLELNKKREEKSP